jgi:glyoxylate carboligase
MSRFHLMPSRFYFHLNNGEDVIRDEEGILVSDADAALIAAMEVIQELRAQDAMSAAEWQGWRLEITDEAGRVIQSLSLDDPLSAKRLRH